MTDVGRFYARVDAPVDAALDDVRAISKGVRPTALTDELRNQRGVAQASDHTAIGVNEQGERIFPDIVSVHEVEGVIVVQTAVDGAVFTAGSRRRMNKVPIAIQEAQIAGRQIMVINAPWHTRGLIHLWR